MMTNLKRAVAALLLSTCVVLPTTAAEKYKAEWSDLDRYPQAEWLNRDKFGIYWHWGIPSISGVAGWYGRMMYQPNNEAYKEHSKVYGDPAQFGYKDLIKLFTADGFSAEEWVDKADRSGARFVVAMGVHHDGFQMGKTKLTRWNSVDMAPHIDIIGELQREAQKRDMKFGVSSHLAFNWEFFSLSMYPDKFDAKEAPDLYNIHDPKGEPSPQFAKLWYKRTKEMIDNYDLDFLWFDFGTKERAFCDKLTAQITADFYNQSVKKDKQVALAAKIGFDNMESLVFDVEHGKFAYTRDNMWMADCTMNYKWFNIRRPEDQYSISGEYWTHHLIDIVSKNGTLLLNMGPNADGSWVPEWEAELLSMGDWLKVNGEAIYETTPWHRFGEGVSFGGDGLAHLMDDQLSEHDVRFTRKGDTLYAIVCGWRSTPIRIKSLGFDDLAGSKIKSVTMLGTDKKVNWVQRDDALSITFPSHKFGKYAYTFKIEGENLFPERKEYVEIDIPTATADGSLTGVREVRVVANDTRALEMAEIYVVGTLGNGKAHNLARFGTPISSGTLPGMGANLAFDNHVNGNRKVGTIAQTESGKNAYLGLKLDKAAKVDRVHLFTEMNSRKDIIENCTLQVYDGNGKLLLNKPVKEMVSDSTNPYADFGVE
ncbi:MAG: alpha-L-fucosidase [Rikenellaceae bacterium]